MTKIGAINFTETWSRKFQQSCEPIKSVTVAFVEPRGNIFKGCPCTKSAYVKTRLPLGCNMYTYTYPTLRTTGKVVRILHEHISELKNPVH